MSIIEYRGKVYSSIEDTGIPIIKSTGSFMAQLPRSEKNIPPVARRAYDGLTFLTYRGATLPASAETYHHSRNVALVIAEMARDSNQPKPVVVADIGTGSGIIAITIAHSLPAETGQVDPTVKVIATDISGRALEVAELNARLNATPQVKFRRKDILEDLVLEFGKIDVIISNPPFFPTDKIADRYKRSDYIPMLAIDGGKDTMAMYRKLFEQAGDALSDKGFIFVEHRTFHQQDVLNLAREHLPGATVLAVNGAKEASTSTAVGSPDTIALVQKYSGGKIII